MSLFQRQYLNTLLKEKDAINKCTLSNKEFDNDLCRFLFEQIKQAENINTTTLADIYNSKKIAMQELGVKKYDTLKKNILDLNKEFEQGDLELVIRKEHREHIVKEHYESSLRKLNYGEDISSVMSNTDSFISHEDNDFERSEINSAKNFVEVYKERTKQIEEMRKNGEITHYSLNHPLLRKYVRIKKGWNGSLIGSSGSGKSLVSVKLLVDFVKEYKLKSIIFTDENPEEVIQMYIQCSYLGLHYRSVDDRTIKLDEVIEKLSKKDREEYEYIMSLIHVSEKNGLPLDEIESDLKIAENNGNPYTLVILDSFDEIDSMSEQQETERYNRNGKLVEVLAKRRNIILMVTAQMETMKYGVSIEKLPMVCNYSSKSLVKKNFFSIVLHWIIDKDGNRIDFACKINKSRSGGGDIVYLVDRNYDYIDLKVSSEELDVQKHIKETNNAIKDEDFGF